MVCATSVKKRTVETKMANVDLTQMKAGQSGIVTEIHGGYGMTRKLDAMGIRLGVRITKVSGQIMRGPVVVRTGNTQVAIGFGMARRVVVEV